MTGSQWKTILIICLFLVVLFLLLHRNAPIYPLTDGQTYNSVQQQTNENRYTATDTDHPEAINKNKALDIEAVDINKNEDINGNNLDKSGRKNRTIWNSLPPGTQMGTLQVAEIRKVLPPDGNLLVWGLGNDSPYWHDSTQGKVIFIEPAGFWFEKVMGKYPYLESYTVTYTTENTKSFNKYINNTQIWSELDIRSQLPPVVVQTSWHVIIVDAPPGFKGQPGRYQSIYTSYLLARNGTHIFVDDYERKVERLFSQKVLGTPIQVMTRSSKPHRNANQQAHFIHISQ